MPPKPRIGVSACLLGHKVRYDGKSKPAPILDELASQLDLIPLCPETAIGLSVPRPPMRLQQTPNGLRILGIANPDFDVTDQLNNYADDVSHHETPWAGFILKSRSPSCGLETTPIYTTRGETVTTGSGAFAHQLKQNLSNIPFIDENEIHDKDKLKTFLDLVTTP